MKNFIEKITKIALISGVALSGIVGAATAQQGNTIAIMDGQVHTVAGSIIEEGDIIIQNGEIISVGANLAAPDGATVIDARGKIVTPGIISPYSSIGIVEIGAVADSNDSGPDRDFRLSAALNAADAYNPVSTLIPVNRAGGVTRAISVPSAGGSIFGGEAIMIDLTGRKNSITRAGVARSLQLGNGGINREGGSRLGVWAVVRETLDEAQTYANDPEGYISTNSEGNYSISDLKALGKVVRGEQRLLVSINRAADIRNLIKLKNDYRLNVIIVGGTEAWREARALAAASIPVILDPMDNLPSSFENLSATLKNAGILNQAGVKIAFFNPPGFGAHNLRLHTQQAGNAVANGLPFDAALAAITRNPAQIFGIGGQLGTLEVGKRGDVVVWDGDPLEVTTGVVSVVIDGQVQSLDNRQEKLLRRYRNLDRGDLPHAYRGGE